MITVVTNEWMDAELNKPWKDRLVLCHLDNDTFVVAKWNGMYWVGQHGIRLSEEIHEVTHFYIFEKFNENDIL